MCFLPSTRKCPMECLSESESQLVNSGQILLRGVRRVSDVFVDYSICVGLLSGIFKSISKYDSAVKKNL